MKILSKRRKKSLIKFALLGLAIFLVFVFIGQQIKIKHKREELEKINEQILVEKHKNDKISGNIIEAENSSSSSNSKIGRRIFENVAQ